MRQHHYNRIEKRFSDFPTPLTASLEENGKTNGPPTEGMRNITAIVGMAAASMGELAKMCLAQAALGNVTSGNNAPLPPPSARVSGLNAGALAGVVSGLGKIGDVNKAGPKTTPAPPAATKPGSPSTMTTPARASATTHRKDSPKPHRKKTQPPMEKTKPTPEPKPVVTALAPVCAPPPDVSAPSQCVPESAI